MSKPTLDQPPVSAQELRELANYAAQAPDEIGTDSPMYRDMLGSLHDAATLIEQQAERIQALEREIVALQHDCETERLRLAACMTAALSNTRDSQTGQCERLQPGHPYYSASYGDVCRAVDREIAHRERAEAAEARYTEQAEELARLKTFVQHQPACYFRLMANSGDRCTCGLDALLAVEEQP